MCRIEDRNDVDELINNRDGLASGSCDSCDSFVPVSACACTWRPWQSSADQRHQLPAGAHLTSATMVEWLNISLMPLFAKVMICYQSALVGDKWQLFRDQPWPWRLWWLPHGGHGGHGGHACLLVCLLNFIYRYQAQLQFTAGTGTSAYIPVRGCDRVPPSASIHQDSNICAKYRLPCVHVRLLFCFQTSTIAWHGVAWHGVCRRCLACLVNTTPALSSSSSSSSST